MSRWSFVIVLFIGSLIASSSVSWGQATEDQQAVNDRVRQTVVKIYSIQRMRSLSSPWKRLSAKTLTGSGVVISPTRILTNHHVVTSTTDVSISLNGQSERLSANVFATSPGLDLAIIELEEPLSDEITPLEIASETPAAGEKIQVFGYPKGGDALSITEGVVSRLEHVSYKYRTSGLRTQIDAPLNSGNSGGPMVADGKVVGIAFSGLTSSNDIGYAIPCEEINIALADLEDGKYDGKPQLWAYTQSLASKDVRKWLKLPEGETGIKFAAMPIPVEDYPLKQNDVITQIGEFDVNNLGKVDLDDKTQVSYIYAVEQSMADGKVPMKIFRQGEAMDVEVPVFSDDHYLLDYLGENPMTYFVYGPIVFSVANADFISSVDSMLARGGTTARSAAALLSYMQQQENPYLMRRYDRVADDNEELVVVTKLIRNEMTRDTSVLLPGVVKSINGININSIRQAAEVINNLDDEQLVIAFDDNRGTTIVLDRKKLERQHDQIMEDNAIVRASSKDLRDIWDR